MMACVDGCHTWGSMPDGVVREICRCAGCGPGRIIDTGTSIIAPGHVVFIPAGQWVPASGQQEGGSQDADQD